MTSMIRRKTPHKTNRLVALLRQRILDGDFPPEGRLPTRNELQAQYQLSAIVVQRALDQLAEDGFVQARGRHGTFVAARLPHLDRYAVLFGARPNGSGWTRFCTALANECQPVAAARARRAASFCGIDGHIDGEDYQQLLRDLRSFRIAGLFFIVAPHELIGSPLMTAPLPRVAIMAPGAIPGMGSIVLDHAGLIDKALDHFTACGRRRVAFIGVPGQEGLRAHFDAGLAARGLATRPYWFQLLDPSRLAAKGAREYAHLLMAHADDRPDAVLIGDDNLVEHAAAGLVAAGVRIPGEVTVVGHCNFPWPTPSAIPMRRLGYDSREVLDAGFAILERLRADAAEPPGAVIPARFEDEIPEPASPSVAYPGARP